MQRWLNDSFSVPVRISGSYRSVAESYRPLSGLMSRLLSFVVCSSCRYRSLEYTGEPIVLKLVERQQIFPRLSMCHLQYLRGTEWINMFIFLHCASLPSHADTFLQRCWTGTGWNYSPPWAGLLFVFWPLHWTKCHFKMKEYDPVKGISHSVPEIRFWQIHCLIHLILAASQHRKWLWLAQWGHQLQAQNKKSYLSVIGSDRGGGCWRVYRCLVSPPTSFISGSSSFAQITPKRK